MGLFTQYSTAIYCAISALTGFLFAWFIQRLGRKQTAASTEIQCALDKTPAQSSKELELMVSSLHELTSRVDSQVGQHSLRVSEITNTLEAPGESGSSQVAVAGKMLITENQKLQADLEAAKSEIRRQRELMSSCVQESRTDALTNIPNRRAFDLEIDRAFAQRRRGGPTFTLVMFDIDYFKRINDRYGHMVGDQLLKCFSRCLTNSLGEFHFVARFGGEEFVAILRKTPLEEALKIAERVRGEIANNQYRIGEIDIQMTSSIGIKEIGNDETEAELLQKADRALYSAKNGGRNRCYYHDGSTCHYFEPELPAEDLERELTEDAVEPASVLPDLRSRLQRKVCTPGNADKRSQL